MTETMARYDSSHDAYHVQRVRRTALSIARQVSSDPASKRSDLLTVELAALLHDVLDKKYVPAEQAADPYAFFLPYFQQWASEGGADLVADGRARDIARIIDNVSWSTEKRLRVAGLITPWHRECVELHCVQDADRLDAIGAFGACLPVYCPLSGSQAPDPFPLSSESSANLPACIMRCAAFSTVSSRPLHTPTQDPAQSSSAIQHFHDKLLHIKDHLKTVPGKRMAEKRHQFPAGAPAAAGPLGLLGIVLQDLNVPVGLTCDPISVLGIGSSSACSAQTVCCEDNSFSGIVALGCTPINVGL
ncbi:hypothetical protein EIP91_003045 [Steccherinum ochraceum]|uniref:HD/PDEase domain-containing protein n=1 Tax=Steccherinum ochraceum TaxID=92696 RepID=A0A4R0RCR0_9APHY|nr:hypothetical protein EIP91_003045 [Steccherinum ochraceum]